MRRIQTAVFLPLALFSVVSCGGDAQTIRAFTSFSELPENGVTQLNGQAVTAAYLADLSTGDVQIVNVSGPNPSTVLLTTENGEAIAIDIAAIGSNVSFDERTGAIAIVGGGYIGLTTSDGRSLALLADDVAQGFEYQTYGAWVTGYGTGSGTVGAGSYGAATSSANVPTGQVANYSGTSAGIARRADGQPYVTVSSVTVSTDFATAGISSSGTEATNINTQVTGPAPELDFSGNGPVADGQFSVDVSGIATTGIADGIFYGPAANEVGGTYQLTGSGGVAHSGSFGATQ